MVAACMPILLCLVVPPLHDDEEFDDDGNVIHKVVGHGEMVATAEFAEALGAKGMKMFRRAQRRIRKQLAEKKMADAKYRPKKVRDADVGQAQDNAGKVTNGPMGRWQSASTKIRKSGNNAAGDGYSDSGSGSGAEAEEEEEPEQPALIRLDKNEVMTKLKKLDKTLRAPVETVLQVGWGGIAWPSNFTAAHLAATHGSIDALEILANAKADLSVRDDWGRTALDYANQHHRRAAANVIEGILRSAGPVESTPIMEPSNNAPSNNMIGKSASGPDPPRQKARAKGRSSLSSGPANERKRRQKASTDLGGLAKEPSNALVVTNTDPGAKAKGVRRKPRSSPKPGDAPPEVQMF